MVSMVPIRYLDLWLNMLRIEWKTPHNSYCASILSPFSVMHKNIKMHKNIICTYSACVTLLFENSVLFSQNLKQTIATNWGK